ASTRERCSTTTSRPAGAACDLRAMGFLRGAADAAGPRIVTTCARACNPGRRAPSPRLVRNAAAPPQAAIASAGALCGATSRASAAAWTLAAIRPTSRTCCVVRPDSFGSFACDCTQYEHLPTIDADSAYSSKATLSTPP